MPDQNELHTLKTHLTFNQQPFQPICQSLLEGPYGSPMPWNSSLESVRKSLPAISSFLIISRISSLNSRSSFLRKKIDKLTRSPSSNLRLLRKLGRGGKFYALSWNGVIVWGVIKVFAKKTEWTGFPQFVIFKVRSNLSNLMWYLGDVFLYPIFVIFVIFVFGDIFRPHCCQSSSWWKKIFFVSSAVNKGNSVSLSN